MQLPIPARASQTLFIMTALIVLCVSSAPAQGQWAWKEANGSTVFSDQPPPPSIPADRILRKPTGSGARIDAPANAASAAVATPGTPAKSSRSMAEIANDLEKQRKERSETEAKEAEAIRKNQRRAEECQRLAQQRSAIAGGMRIRSAETGGAMNDEERGAEVARLEEQIASYCQ